MMLLRRVPPTYRTTMVGTGALSLALTITFLFLPLTGTDLSAQVARGQFVDSYGFHPVDFRWYGGIFPFGYSLLTGVTNALVGAREVGAISSVVGALAFAFLLVRVRVPRPLAGGLLGAACLVFNLVSGRTTFAMGTAIGLLALCALTLEELGPRTRTTIAVILAALSTMASPVSGLFVGLCGIALLLTGRRRDGLALALAAGIPMLGPAFVFPDGGVQPFDGLSGRLIIALAIAVVFLVPKRWRALRVGAVIYALGLVVAVFVPTPVGFNAARLVLLFGIPVVVATMSDGWPRIALAVIVMAWWQPPLVLGDWTSAGDPSAQRSFYAPLVAQLDERTPVGRVEVVPLANHWESTYLADRVPIARGWERQVDVERSPLFYNNTLDPSTYLTWLQDNGVSYVALPKRVNYDVGGREEASLVQADPYYLDQVWQDETWTLYRFTESQPLVTRPGRLVRADATGVTFDATGTGSVLIRVRWSRWLTLSGPHACLVGGSDWTLVQVNQPGRYRISSGLHLRQPDRCH